MTNVASKGLSDHPGSTVYFAEVWLTLGHLAFFSLNINYSLVLWKLYCITPKVV